MSKALADAKAKIAKLNTKTEKGKAEAIAIAVAGREAANKAAHAARKEAHAWADLARSLEIDPEARANRKRGPGFTILPSKSGK